METNQHNCAIPNFVKIRLTVLDSLQTDRQVAKKLSVGSALKIATCTRNLQSGQRAPDTQKWQQSSPSSSSSSAICDAVSSGRITSTSQKNVPPPSSAVNIMTVTHLPDSTALQQPSLTHSPLTNSSNFHTHLLPTIQIQNVDSL